MTSELILPILFQVLSKDGEHVVGKIYKQWAGVLRETFTDADHFGITFPMDLDVRMKAVMLGACFLIVRLLLSYSIISIFLSNDIFKDIILFF